MTRLGIRNFMPVAGGLTPFENEPINDYIEKPGPSTMSQPRPAEVSAALFAQHNGPRYRTPIDLLVTPNTGCRFLIISGCMAQPLPEIALRIHPELKGDFVLYNNFGPLPEIAPVLAAQYDFQIVHIPLRTVFTPAYFRLPSDAASHEEFLRQTQEQLNRYLFAALRLNTERKLTTYVLGFMVPQQNPLGRLQPRYDLRNVMHFIERLNMFLAAEVARLENAYYVDVDQIAASLGKKFCQDDALWSFTHGTTLSDGDHGHDLNRLEPPVSAQNYYTARWLDFFESLMHEILAMHRSLKQPDAVKLVAVDLDDTLWRGVAAEGTLGVLEGWPMGFIETLLILKQRGLLLAVVSKNDEAFIRAHWDRLVQGQIALSDFVAIKVNFRDKSENLAEILREANLRPQNAVMIDDNPVERAALEAALPGVRVLGRHLYYLRRILLWSAETQPPSLTPESARRTEMVQAQLRRESDRQSLSSAEFLRTLQLRLTLSVLRDTRDLRFSRALELLNKTNQFNTTGERYTIGQCHARFTAGHRLYVMEAEDRFTCYGLIGAGWVRGNTLDQVVLSCRTLGLGLEDALLARLAGRLAARNEAALLGTLRETEANLACRTFYSRNGFVRRTNNPSLWIRLLVKPLMAPEHIEIIDSVPIASSAQLPCPKKEMELIPSLVPA